MNIPMMEHVTYMVTIHVDTGNGQQDAEDLVPCPILVIGKEELSATSI